MRGHGTMNAVPPRPALRVLRDSFPDRPAFGTAVSEAILTRVAAGELEPTLRLHRPGPELALSKQDAVSPGFAAAVAAGQAAGFEPVLRLAGGRAAAFHEGTLALSHATPAATPARSTHERFELASAQLTSALRALGIDARLGAVPREYCPGRWSVNARGAVKLVGIGQRLVSGGAHVGAVLVVSGSERLRDLLVAVYEALGLDWDPATVGSVEDEVPGTTLDDVERAIMTTLESCFELVPAELDEETLELAARLEAARVPCPDTVKLLAFSDLHRDLAAARSLVEASAEADVVIAAGDFASVHDGLEPTIDALREIERPTLLVPGNNETEEALRDACRGWDAATVLHGEGTELDGVAFWGLGAGVPVTPWDWSFDLDEDEAAELLAEAPEGCVLVVHSPPHGHVDVSGSGEHLGSESILRAIGAKRPRLAVCGHIHESWGAESRLGDSRIVNLGPGGTTFELAA